MRCPACHSPVVRPHGQKERRFRHLPIGRKRVELVFPIPRVECEHCGAVRQNLPRAVLVYDAFHVIQLFNHNLPQLRRELYSQSKDKTDRWMLKDIRWHLLKNPENLNEANGEKARLEEALWFNQPLATAY